jgi:hypothetical protein
MTLLLLEALGAGLLFIGIIWWTMFSGRKNGELPQDTATPTPPTPPVLAPSESAAHTESKALLSEKSPMEAAKTQAGCGF